VFLTEFTSPYSLNTQRGWGTSKLFMMLLDPRTADLVYDTFGPIQPPNRWVPWADLLKLKWAEPEVDLSSADVLNARSFTSAPLPFLLHFRYVVVLHS